MRDEDEDDVAFMRQRLPVNEHIDGKLLTDPFVDISTLSSTDYLAIVRHESSQLQDVVTASIYDEQLEVERNDEEMKEDQVTSSSSSEVEVNGVNLERFLNLKLSIENEYLSHEKFEEEYELNKNESLSRIWNHPQEFYESPNKLFTFLFVDKKNESNEYNSNIILILQFVLHRFRNEKIEFNEVSDDISFCSNHFVKLLQFHIRLLIPENQNYIFSMFESKVICEEELSINDRLVKQTEYLNQFLYNIYCIFLYIYMPLSSALCSDMRLLMKNFFLQFRQRHKMLKEMSNIEVKHFEESMITQYNLLVLILREYFHQKDLIFISHSK
ncbi:hypothetical protein SNEBB_002837 [Seison nebaliae]|nr:hypothetical protein SNEBB_002837 [Seison nebaliae]